METMCRITETDKISTHLKGENRLKDVQGQSYASQTLNENGLDSKRMLKAWYIQQTPHPQTPATKTSRLFHCLHKETQTNC